MAKKSRAVLAQAPRHLVFCTLFALALAQPAAPKPAPARPHVSSDKLAQSYAALPLAERIAIEADLIFTGDYDGITDGEFGERAVAAVKAFQLRNGGKDTGVLNPPERAALKAAARAKAEAVGWRLVDDQVTGARLGIAAKLMPQSLAQENGMKFSSAHGEVVVQTFRLKESTSLAAVFAARREEGARKPDYSVLKPEFFVLAGRLNGVKKFYERADAKDGEVRGFTASYDIALEGTMATVVTAMSSAFVGFPSELGNPAVHRKVEYATAIIIDSAGNLLSARRATEDCFSLALAGLGQVERVAADGDLALLRLYGARNLHPLPIAPSPAKSLEEVTVVGVADPKAQGGGAGVSAMRARLVAAGEGERQMLEPVPQAGFSGAAVLDEAGKLIGMVELSTPQTAVNSVAGAQAMLVGGEHLRGFLEQQNVRLPAAAPRERAQWLSGVARVICSRH